MAFVLLAAGYETTVSLIGNGALALLLNPGQMAALRADPQLIGPAIEEFLRYDGPVKVNSALRFAHGLHYCLGAPLARAEGQIAISPLLNACQDLALDADPAELTWRRSRLVRGLKHLPVSYAATATGIA